MTKEELIKNATDIWCLYGQAINKAFELKGFLIESEPLEYVLKSNSEEKIKKFIAYVNKQITVLNNI
jgi:hypothetical protein